MRVLVVFENELGVVVVVVYVVVVVVVGVRIREESLRELQRRGKGEENPARQSSHFYFIYFPFYLSLKFTLPASRHGDDLAGTAEHKNPLMVITIEERRVEMATKSISSSCNSEIHNTDTEFNILQSRIDPIATGFGGASSAPTSTSSRREIVLEWSHGPRMRIRLDEDGDGDAAALFAELPVATPPLLQPKPPSSPSGVLLRLTDNEVGMSSVGSWALVRRVGAEGAMTDALGLVGRTCFGSPRIGSGTVGGTRRRDVGGGRRGMSYTKWGTMAWDCSVKVSASAVERGSYAAPTTKLNTDTEKSNECSAQTIQSSRRCV